MFGGYRIEDIDLLGPMAQGSAYVSFAPVEVQAFDILGLVCAAHEDQVFGIQGLEFGHLKVEPFGTCYAGFKTISAELPLFCV